MNLSLLYYIDTNKLLEIPTRNTQEYKLFISLYKSIELANKLTSELDNLEWQNTIDNIISPITKNYDIYKEVYANYIKILNNLLHIEKNGICVDKILFEKKYKVVTDFIYPKYNIYTITGRPSCNGIPGNVNLFALKKSDNTRKCFISRYNDGVLVEIDLVASHPYIISDFIDFEFCMNPYEYLGKKLFDTEDLTSEQLIETKKKTFRILYGNDDHNDIEFFKDTKKFIDELYNKFLTNEYVELPSGRKFTIKNLGMINKGKLFSYFIQAIEFEKCMEVIGKINDILNSSKNIKLILYQYDSFLFDIDPTEINTIYQINELIKEKMHNTRIKFGKNYGEMKLYE